MLKLGVLISGRGSNLVAIHQAIVSGVLAAEIKIVVSNKVDAAGLSWAREQGIVAVGIDPKLFGSFVEYESEVKRVLLNAGVEWVILAGYLRLVGETLLGAFRMRMLNIHPSLLPAFKGLHAQRQALEAGVKESGCTVHLVDETLDGGPILAQAKVPVLEGDTEATLSARILEQEHRLYPAVLVNLAEGIG